MNKRYQVFVSSTYADLIHERNEVMQALLELDCMPAGMELFPAANDDSWTWIKKVIDESDYYIVVVGGRYGSVVDSTGISFTEMEYRYAVDSGKPVVGFIHEDPGTLAANKCEQDAKKKELLDNFRRQVMSRLCKKWSSPSDLGAKVSRSVTQLLKQYPAVGWVRADQVQSLLTAPETLKLREEIAQLRAENAKLSIAQPSLDLASGEDKYSIRYSYTTKEQAEVNGRKTWRYASDEWADITTTWNALFRYLAPSMLNGLSVWEIDQYLNHFVEKCCILQLEKKHPGRRFYDVRAAGDSRRTILIHLRALKLISLEPDGKNWILTEQGDRYMTSLIAVAKQPANPAVGRKKSK